MPSAQIEVGIFSITDQVLVAVECGVLLKLLAVTKWGGNPSPSPSR